MSAEISSWVLYGCGNLGSAIARGLIHAGTAPQAITAIQRNPEKRRRLVGTGLQAFAELPEGLRPDAVVVAVKPGDVVGVLGQLQGKLPPDCLVISVAAGVRYAALRRAAPGLRTFRIRPSVLVERCRGNVLVGEPVAGGGVPEVLLRQLGRLGRVFVLPEPLMERATWESSSIPLLVVPKIMRDCVAAADAADRATLARILISGLEGMLDELRTAEHGGEILEERIDALAGRIVSPGGINRAALAVMDERKVWQALNDAADAYRVAEGELIAKANTP